MKKKVLVFIAALLIITMSAVPCFAGKPTDEILNYIITADVNPDGTLNLDYYIEWKVLETAGLGPLEWVNIGIPHDGYLSIEPLSSNIESIYYSGSYGSNVEVNFTKDYGKNEVCTFEFKVIMDYMYQIGGVYADQTTFAFRPGWFDEIAVDNLEIHWKKDNIVSASEGYVETDSEYVWRYTLAPGEQVFVDVSYPNDAYAFDPAKDASQMNNHGGSYDDYNPGNDYYEDSGWEVGLGAIIFFGFWFVFFRGIVNAFKANSGFGTKTETKITRTKVEYYPVCQGCGSPRPDGATECKYCGRSFIKSEEILKEDEIKGEDKEALKYKTNGEYHYSSSPNTFVRVNVVHVPVRVAPTRSSGSSGSHRSSGGCAHSSCACACASCACACACACAGGGRAGCTSKDFYNTGLKLKQLELKKYNKNRKDE